MANRNSHRKFFKFATRTAMSFSVARSLLTRTAVQLYSAQHRSFAGASVAPALAWSFPQVGEALWDFLWRAVQKSKVSPGRKRSRLYHRAPTKVTGYSTCVECNAPLMRHRLCVCWEKRIKPSANVPPVEIE